MSRSIRAYLAVQFLLAMAAVLLPGRWGGALGGAAVIVGGTVFVIGVARRRPQPLLGWWLIAVSAFLDLVSAAAVLADREFPHGATMSAPVPVILAAATLPLLAIGLALLSRVTPRWSVADGLDAVIIATAFFLLLWTFALDPLLDAGPVRPVDTRTVAVAIIVPAGALLVLAMALKIVLSGGLRDRAIRVLLVAVAAQIVSGFLVVVPVLRNALIDASPLAGLLWLAYGIPLGVVGLHPALGTPRERGPQNPGDLSRGRLILYAVLGLVAPLAWLLERTDPPTGQGGLLGYGVPLATSAVFLLLLMARLGLIARVAQQRAGQLERRTAALAHAMAEQEDLQKQLTHRALHDPLTGLANRVVLAERMEWALTRRGKHGQQALLLLDLDGFKDVNDTMGHPVGDELLVEVAHRLVDAAPADATLTRLGGDEFAVLLEDVDTNEVLRRAEDFHAALRRSYEIAGRDLFLTASVGAWLSDIDQTSVTPSDALRDADLALYAAKEAGKDRTSIFEPRMRTARLDHSRISTGLRQALANEELVLHYQPVVDLNTGGILAVEALIRWEPSSGLVPPLDFVPVAEDTGLIVPIGTWALHTACQVARPWWDRHRVAVTVNVSGRQLDDPRFADVVFGALADAGLPGAGLILEITESTLVATSGPGHLRDQLDRLRAAGVRIAIDDFGTGYSSLSYVAQLPADIVKIDKAFTQAETGFGSPNWAFTRAILQLVDNMHMLAIAEGVETAEQAQALRALRCPLAQGYLYARPMPAPAIDDVLAAPRSA